MEGKGDETFELSVGGSFFSLGWDGWRCAKERRKTRASFYVRQLRGRGRGTEEGKHRRMAVRRNRSRIAWLGACEQERNASFRPPPQIQDFLNHTWMEKEMNTAVRWGTPCFTSSHHAQEGSNPNTWVFHKKSCALPRFRKKKIKMLDHRARSFDDMCKRAKKQPFWRARPNHVYLARNTPDW